MSVGPNMRFIRRDLFRGSDKFGGRCFFSLPRLGAFFKIAKSWWVKWCQKQQYLRFNALNRFHFQNSCVD